MATAAFSRTDQMLSPRWKKKSLVNSLRKGLRGEKARQRAGDRQGRVHETTRGKETAAGQGRAQHNGA